MTSKVNVQTTAKQAAKAVKTWLADRNIEVRSVRGRTVGFQDLPGCDGIFVMVAHNEKWHEQWITDLYAAFKPKQCGFHIEISPNMLRPRPANVQA